MICRNVEKHTTHSTTSHRMLLRHTERVSDYLQCVLFADIHMSVLMAHSTTTLHEAMQIVLEVTSIFEQ